MTRIIALSLIGFFLSACQPQVSAPTEAFAEPGVEFTLQPIAQESCDPAQPYSVRVRWDVKDMDNPKFDFRLDHLNGQLPARSNDAKGKFDTDPWARPGQWFLIVERTSGRALAAAQVPPLSCSANDGA